MEKVSLCQTKTFWTYFDKEHSKFSFVPVFDKRDLIKWRWKIRKKKWRCFFICLFSLLLLCCSCFTLWEHQLSFLKLGLNSRQKYNLSLEEFEVVHKILYWHLEIKSVSMVNYIYSLKCLKIAFWHASEMMYFLK